MFFFSYKSSEFFIKKRVKFYKNLLISKIKQAGRSNLGNIILRGRGGGFKFFYRLIDFKRLIINIPAKILKFEYDPNRNIFIMLLLYYNGVLTYVLAPLLVKINTFILTRNFIYYKNGNGFLLNQCLVGSFVHCVHINSNISKIARSAGVYILIVRKFASYCLLRLPSREEFYIFSKNLCVLGRLSNFNFKLIKKTSAGINRRLGIRPIVRGVAKNPVDHPHGGGSGRTTAGQPSVSAWGIYTKGVRTTTRFIRKYKSQRWGFFKRRNGTNW
jgi:large subunit ribosomal protein L2